MEVLGFVLIIICLIALAGIWKMMSLLGEIKQGKLQTDEQATRDMINQVFGEITHKVVAQTKLVLEADKEAIFLDNQNKKQVIEKMVADMKREIDERQAEIRSLERDRNKKFGEITTAIEEHRKITQELKTTTDSLSKVLSNNQTRGQWGERIIEDILTSAGLLEKIHYVRQEALGTSMVKPDITLLLPNQRKVCIDVKFPYAEVQKMALAESKSAKDIHLKAFTKDLREKIKQIESRGYIDVEHGTLDYAIMFVPNEMLFSFINQQFPDIIDEAMSKKVMIVSPFTFLIVARTVFESYRNFMIENNLRKIVKHIQQFVEEWDKFTSEFDRFDDFLSKMRDQFEKIRTTRYKQMSLRIRRIEEDQKGAAQLDTAKTKLLD